MHAWIACELTTSRIDVSVHLPGDQDSVVVMSHPVFWNAVAVTVMRQDGLLPLAETVQRLVSVMVNLQVRLPKTTHVQYCETRYSVMEKPT